MLQVMNRSAQVRDALPWLKQHLTFDVDERVHVFELTIRAVGTQPMPWQICRASCLLQATLYRALACCVFVDTI